MLETPHLIAPGHLPDGSYAWHETGGDVGRLVEDLRAYDPRLSLVRNDALGRWEVWRTCEDEIPRRICSRPGLHAPNAGLLVDWIAHCDTRRGFDPIAHTIAHNDAVDKAAADAQDAIHEDKADRLAFALGRDLDIPAQDGRVFSLGGGE